MDLMNQLEGMLGKAGGGSPAELEKHFETVSGAVPQEQLAQGITSAFNSNQTPAFGDMVARLFNQSNPDQKAGLLNHLISLAGPGVLSNVLGQAGLSGIAQGGQVTPQQATQVDPQAVNNMATTAHQQNPNVMEAVSGFYAQHPTLVKTLGVAALSIVLHRMTNR